jgi:uncharacterized membrane protein YGL010W
MNNNSKFLFSTPGLISLGIILLSISLILSQLFGSIFYFVATFIIGFLLVAIVYLILYLLEEKLLHHARKKCLNQENQP